LRPSEGGVSGRKLRFASKRRINQDINMLPNRVIRLRPLKDRQSYRAPVLMLVALRYLAGTRAYATTPPIASTVQINSNDIDARFIMELSGPVSYVVYATEAPYRVIIDLPEIDFQLPRRHTGSPSFVKQYRYGSLGAGKARIAVR
jgi:hypothetical protein